MALMAAVWSVGRPVAMDSPAPVKILGSISTGSDIEITASRDVNGDGIADLVVHSVTSDKVFVYFGPGTGEREPDVRVTSVGGHPLHAAPIGDVDGDGFRDLAFSEMYGEPATYHGTGPTYLVRGRRDWPKGIELPRDADSTLYLDPGPDARLMACIADQGVDLNRDGLADLVIGGGDYSPPDRRSAGAAFVLFGRRAWADRINVATEADVTIHGSHTGQALGGMCGTGDFNADALPDLALVATDSTLWGLRGNRGAAYVFAGRETWPRLLDADRDALVKLSADRETPWTTPPQLMDVNGDGADDLVAAMAGWDARVAGRLAMLFGSRERRGVVAERAADVLIEGNGRFAFALASADLDRDGRADLLVSAPDAATVHVIPGRADWQPRGPAEQYGRAMRGRKDARLGGRSFALGDFDGDGVLDAALGINARSFGLVMPSLPLSVDVRPRNDVNVLVPGGIVAIAVRLQEPRTDELDISSLRVGHAAPNQSTRDAGGGVQIYFDVDALRLEAHARRLTVVGRTRGGIPVAGSDSIVVASVPGR